MPRRSDKAAFVSGGVVRSCLAGEVELNGHFVMTAIAASMRFRRPSVLLVVPRAGSTESWQSTAVLGRCVAPVYEVQ